MAETTWVELERLMIEGPSPEPSVRGVLRSDNGNDGRYGWFAYDEPRPSLHEPLRVWRAGPLVRVERIDGRPVAIVGRHTCWRFDDDNDVPVAWDADFGGGYDGEGTDLLRRRAGGSEPYRGYLGDDDVFRWPTGPIVPTTFLGRAAWAVELSAPEREFAQQLVVDAETGLVLQRRADAFDSVDEWLEFVVEDVDPALFEWTGPVRSPEEAQDDRDAWFEAEAAERRQWFTDNVSPRPLRLEVLVTPEVWERRQDGGFTARIELGPGSCVLTRRRLSSEPWDDVDWLDEASARWSDGTWEWALAFEGVLATPECVDGIRRHLSGAGED